MTTPLTDSGRLAPRDPSADYVVGEYLAVVALLGIPAALLYAPLLGTLLLGGVLGVAIGVLLPSLVTGRARSGGPATGRRASTRAGASRTASDRRATGRTATGGTSSGATRRTRAAN